MSDAVAHPRGADTDLFSEEYFRQAHGSLPSDRSGPEWPLIFGRIAEQIVRTLRPGRVLDAGCGMGFLVEALQDRGVSAWGIDVSSYAIARVRPDIRSYCRVGSLTEPIDGRYDFVTCLDVLGYLPEEQVQSALRNLTACTDTILFSSVPPDGGENVPWYPKPSITWLRLFGEQGFSPDLTYDASFVAPHAMLLRRQPQHSAEVLQLFAECLRGRHAGVEKERARAEVAAMEAKLAGARAEAERQAEYFEHFRRLQDQLMTNAQELSSEVLRRTENPPVTAGQLADLETRLRNDLAEKQNLSPDLRQLVSEHADLRAQVARLDRRATELDRTVQGLSGHLDSILHSRIWQTFVRAGGILLRLSGGK